MVVGLDQVSYRLLNDGGEPILYDKSLFEVLETTIPADWVTINGNDGDYYTDPAELAAPGFYERWHDRDPLARAQFLHAFERLKKLSFY